MRNFDRMGIGAAGSVAVCSLELLRDDTARVPADFSISTSRLSFSMLLMVDDDGAGRNVKIGAPGCQDSVLLCAGDS